MKYAHIWIFIYLQICVCIQYSLKNVLDNLIYNKTLKLILIQITYILKVDFVYKAKNTED